MSELATVRSGGATLIVEDRRRAELQEHGLDGAAGWIERLRRGRNGSGRGATAVLGLRDGTRLRLKQLRRGGLLRAALRERFAGARRPRGNLIVGREARRRGIATPAPVALLTVAGPSGLVRAWVAHEEIEDARDLRALLRDAWCEAPARSAIRVVRDMHECGLEHRDLNVGNLLCRRKPQGQWAAWVVDLDGARLHDEPLVYRLRQRSLRRLERSCAKAARDGWHGAPLAERLYDWYAEGDASLGERLGRGRAVGRWLVRVHRSGWSRTRS